MAIAIITGSAGLVGSEATRYFAGEGLEVIGIDNDMRARFFGPEASTGWMRDRLIREVPGYTHEAIDIRDQAQIFHIFQRFGKNIKLVIHAAAQPSHDWAAQEPFIDFSINANGTHTLLEATRRFASDAVFIFTSTNKVYGDAPNRLPLIEMGRRWEIDPTHRFRNGITEEMSVDHSLHSLFGVSKLAADEMVQEYARSFGMKTICFRGGCLTGPNHSGTQLHGFLAYLVRCSVSQIPYTVFCYSAKQVRDNIHSIDLIQAFDQVFRAPRGGEVYNMGGGRFSNCSMLEAIDLCQEITGMELGWVYVPEPRKGDHIWYVSDLSRFESHYPGWRLTYDVPAILREIYESNRDKWANKLRGLAA